ncbi:hypothetical protein [Tardiphaga sp. vice278]|uniref:hypothetical protein n=1 Tax=Tardiphaga sp. vice278 TaxID=2592815 RepID=UPI001FF003F0|nr:hypothetical protein [Tardiphaga sp. vice278]
MSRTNVMTRAWAMFRQAYNYPRIKFASIGRKCFASCLRAAWAEARKAAKVSAMPAAAKAARIVELTDTIRFAPFSESWRQASREISAARAELARLTTATAAYV